ncbi:hypothetical protein Syun_001149 [Stephania yunnanensis]|uniref:Uncharacterized protein n=1 Tax=Stephania yunnanensis TaxID=152371 RepID=A0AAP0LIU4_9MAGN
MRRRHTIGQVRRRLLHQGRRFIDAGEVRAWRRGIVQPVEAMRNVLRLARIVREEEGRRLLLNKLFSLLYAVAHMTKPSVIAEPEVDANENIIEGRYLFAFLFIHIRGWYLFPFLYVFIRVLYISVFLITFNRGWYLSAFLVVIKRGLYLFAFFVALSLRNPFHFTFGADTRGVPYAQKIKACRGNELHYLVFLLVISTLKHLA